MVKTVFKIKFKKPRKFRDLFIKLIYKIDSKLICSKFVKNKKVIYNLFKCKFIL